MSAIGRYLLSVVAVALLISISNTLVKKGNAVSSIAKLLSGLVLTIVIVSPWTDLRISDFTSLNTSVEIEASNLVQEGKQIAQEELADSIKTQLCSYILDKASELGLNPAIEVVITDETPPSINKIIINGAASPYAKQRLIQVIRNDFGITEECLEWT